MELNIDDVNTEDVINNLDNIDVDEVLNDVKDDYIEISETFFAIYKLSLYFCQYIGFKTLHILEMILIGVTFLNFILRIQLQIYSEKYYANIYEDNAVKQINENYTNFIQDTSNKMKYLSDFINNNSDYRKWNIENLKIWKWQKYNEYFCGKKSLDTIDEENEEENEEIKMEVSETNEEETSQHSESSEEIKVEGSELNEQEKDEGIKVESSELNEEETSQHSESSEEKKLEGSETNEEEISQHSESSEEKNLEVSETNEIENEVKKKLSIELPDESVFELPKKYEVPSIKKSFDYDTNDNFSDSNSPDYKENNITQFVNEVE